MRFAPSRSVLAAAVALISFTSIAACGDDDAEEGVAGENFTAYCDAATAIDEADGLPTEEMMQASFDAAPEEIRPQVGALRTLQEESGGDFGIVLADPAFAENLNALERWEADHCGPTHADPELIEPEGDEAAADGATVVEIDAVDYAFAGEIDDLAAGPVAISVANAGDAAHEALLARLADGVTAEEVLAFDGDPFEAGLVSDAIGNVTVHVPGSTRVLNADLEPGTYALVCFIPGPDQTPHAALGMHREFTVS